MGRRLKQIKKIDLGGFEKKVVDSLIDDKPRRTRDDGDKHESMRCKIDIFDDTNKNNLVDSFVLNTNSLKDTISDIISNYGNNVQFIITNLFDEKVVAKRFIHKDGYGKDQQDRMYFNNRMITVSKVHKMKNEGISVEDVCDKMCHIATRQYIRDVYNKSEEEIIQKIRDEYGNQSLGKRIDTEDSKNRET